MTSLALNPSEIQSASDSKPKGSFWSATFMVSGTCIGGGMLAMPVQTAESGFVFSSIALLVCWAFMTFTGLLLIEATMWVKNETHFASLSRILVGNSVKIIALVVYLFMNYASLVAYTAGGASLLDLWGKSLFDYSLGYELGCVLYTALFGLVVLMGAHVIGKMNLCLMIGLVATYFCLTGFGVSSIRSENLVARPALFEHLGVMGIILATFSYQMVVPSICSYLNYDVKMLKRAVITGTTISLLVYFFWILVVHGIVPLDGEDGLREAWANGASATIPLRSRLNNGYLTVLADIFAFFAVTTSFLGLSLALFHFLKDCLGELKINMGRNMIVFLTIVPTLYMAISYPRALLQCLDLSGGFGDTTLSGLIPITMVWMGRYRKQLDVVYQAPGGKTALVAAAFFFFLLLMQQFYQLM